MDTTEFQTMARNLMRDNYLHDWTFKWMTTKRLGGECNHTDKVLRFSVDWVRLNDEIFLRNLVTHEIAHALLGARHGHGPAWKRMHRSLGGDGMRCIDTASQPDAVAPAGRYTGVCAAGHMFSAHRTLKNMWARGCSRCSKKWNPAHLITWTDTVTGQKISAPAAEPVRRLVRLEDFSHMVNAATGERTALRPAAKPPVVAAPAPPWVAGSSDWDAMWGDN